MASPVELVRVGRHAGRQIDRHHRHAEAVDVGDDGFEQPGERSMKPGADDGIDDQVALGDLAEVQLPFLRVGDLDHGQADAAEDLEVRARVTANVAHAAEQEDGRLDAALRQRARDDEAVAAVVAAPAQHADAARGQVVEGRFHRRDRLPAGVLHQHDRRQADFVDGLTVRFPHLLRIQHAHVG